MSRAVTLNEFKTIKRMLAVPLISQQWVCTKTKRSIMVINQIKFSKTFEDYNEQSRARHQKVKVSLRDMIFKLHFMKFKNDEYVRPLTAQKAISELIEEQANSI